MSKQFCVYGDNIVECERMIRLVKDAIAPISIKVSGNPTAPEYTCRLPNEIIVIATFPGFGRWENDIVKNLRDSGGVLREAPDIIMTKRENNLETTLLAIEFCSALPAGNQAWQRSGRAYSTVKAGVPYVFITEIGGYELDAGRNKKAPRMPNPAVPYSYYSYASTSKSQITIVYQMNPGANAQNKELYANSIGDIDFSKYLKTFILGGDSFACFQNLQTHLLDFVVKLSSKKKSGRLSATDWAHISTMFAIGRRSDALIEMSNFPWKKKISIPTSKTFANMFAAGRSLCKGLASCDLPIAILPREKVERFYGKMVKAYGASASKFSTIKDSPTDIAICWYAGFKPKGDDARPDRGVLPLARMLLGDTIPIITFIYGPATPTMLKLLENHPDILQKSNGLWEATLSLSDYVICDPTSTKRPILQFGMMNDIRDRRNIGKKTMPANTKHFPEGDFIGENDVDSIIHLIFTVLLEDKCFEMMCNPPGGDWSGISLMCNGNQFRWLTLPRVSANAYKRPDHVIQIGSDIVLSIESKDFFRNLEKDIGPRLNGYCKELFSTQPSCVNSAGSSLWSDQTGHFALPDLKYVSASAFLLNNDNDILNALDSAKTEIVFGIQFKKDYTAIVKIALSDHIDTTVRQLIERLCRQTKVGRQADLKVEIELI